MTRIPLILCLILMLVPGLDAQISLGINAGPTRMDFSGDPPEGIGFFSPQMGYSSALQVNYRFNNGMGISAQPGYSVLRSKYSVMNDSGTQVVDSTQFTIHSFSFPLHAIVWSENGRFYVLAGLELTYIFDFTGKVIMSPGSVSSPEYDVSKYNFYAHFGAGFIIPLGRPYLSFEIRYSQGLNDLTAPIVHQNSNLPRTKLTNTNLLVGLHIPLGKSEVYKLKKNRN